MIPFPGMSMYIFCFVWWKSSDTVSLSATVETTAFSVRVNPCLARWAWVETASLGKYYDSITPSGAGGQPFQILWLHKHGYSDGNSSAMTITGYITMQTGFILLALSTFIFARSVELEAIRFTAYLGLLFFSLVPALMILFSYKPKIVKRLIAGIIRLGAKIRVKKTGGIHATICQKAG